MISGYFYDNRFDTTEVPPLFPHVEQNLRFQRVAVHDNMTSPALSCAGVTLGFWPLTAELLDCLKF